MTLGYIDGEHEIAVFKSHGPLFTQVYQRQIDRGGLLEGVV